MSGSKRSFEKLSPVVSVKLNTNDFFNTGRNLRVLFFTISLDLFDRFAHLNGKTSTMPKFWGPFLERPDN